MSISLASLDQSNTAAARALLQKYWDQDWSDDFTQRFFAWRYLTRPADETLLAMDKDRCVAIIAALVRPYLLADRRVTVRETFDWFCLPEYRRIGLGLKLIRQMMARPEPIIVIGGTETTQSLLPRLKWHRLPEVPNYYLPVSFRLLAAFGLSRVLAGSEGLARLIPPNMKIRRPRRVHPPSPTAEVRVSKEGGIPPPPPAGAYALTPLIDKPSLGWLALAPREVGDLFTLNFYLDGELVGLSISRLERRARGPAAKILHLQSAMHSQTIIQWITGETANYLVAQGAGLVICRASCPIVGAALRKVGFLSDRPLPAFWWPAGGVVPEGRMHLTKMIGDDSIEFRPINLPQSESATGDD